jgi:carbon-monoxide dehydrogenase medium subunit
LLKQKLPILPEAAAQIGDAQVRNMGTIGGSLAHADPSADLPAVMLALGAELTAVGSKGTRTIAVDDFFLDLLTTSLASDELLTQIRIPLPPAGSGMAYEKYPHPASRYALVGVAAVVTRTADKVTRARVAITGVGTKATRELGVERALTGTAGDAAAIETAAARAAEGIDLRSDLQGTAEYRAQLARTYTKRALTRALERRA